VAAELPPPTNPRRPAIPVLRNPVLLLVVAALVAVPSARAQDGKDQDAGKTSVWRLEGLRNGFCVRFLLDPAKLRRQLPRDARLLRADAVPDLHPALRRVVATQPEFASWSPSALCLYYLRQVDAGSTRTDQRDPEKAPVVGIWTTAAGTTEGPRELVLAFLSTDGDLRHAGREANLDFERLQSRVGEVPREDGPPRPGETRYQIRLGKTVLTWDGRASDDTTRAPEPLSWVWESEGRRGGWVKGKLRFTPDASMPMIGSLRVQGKDPVALALQASPIRFVGPSYQGGSGELQISQ
jgi:hypothetical protein